MPEEKAPVEEKKKDKRKGKKKRSGKKHSSSPMKKFYSIKDGKIVRSGKFCPRCGPGTFLAAHKFRSYCGRCGYTEFEKRK